ncbi:hypothetical protein LZ31DRAFT_1930 [Colletotrichum somersetense]|nr:hypothetical protein LZ31DRAFT_1930 [Colletotrichum somersetense]
MFLFQRSLTPACRHPLLSHVSRRKATPVLTTAGSVPALYLPTASSGGADSSKVGRATRPRGDFATASKLPPRRAPGASSDAMALILSLDVTIIIRRGCGLCFRRLSNRLSRGLPARPVSPLFLDISLCTHCPSRPFTCLHCPWPCTLLFCESVASA